MMIKLFNMLAHQYETFENLPFGSLRGAKRRSNLIEFVAKARLLRCTRNDNFGILKRSQYLYAV